MRELRITDSLITAPTDPAVTLAYTKQHLKSLGTADDALVLIWIAAATSYFEEQTGRQLITATREVWLDAFPFLGATGRHARIELPHPPLQAVESVEYVDGYGNTASFDDGASPAVPSWTTTAPEGPYARRGFVEPLPGTSWPIARDQTAAVKIRYTCGYGDADTDIPELAKGVLCYLVAHFDTFRAAVHEARRGQVLELPYGVQAMLDGFKLSALPSQVLHAEHHWSSWHGWRSPWA